MDKDIIDVKVEEKTKSKKVNNKKSDNNTKTILICSILLSFVCGMMGAYLINQTVSTESVIKNITQSELVENSISSSVDNIYSSTLLITASANGKTKSTGTGFIYKIENDKAYIMTNNHVVDGADSVTVEFNDSSEKIEATIQGAEAYSDIAVLTIKNNNYKAASIGESNKIKLGDTIFTVGSPMGETYKGTVTKGILSGKDRMVEVSLSSSSVSDYYMKVLQIDAAVNPGNSGGPLCDVSGNVIGIISLKIVQDEVEGMGFAIPIEDALEYATKIENGEKITRPYLGISMLDLSEEYALWQYRISIPEGVEKGIAIVSVEEGSAADKAGLEKGDIVVKIGDKDINSLAEFRYELYKHEVGETISVTLYRDNKLKTLNVTLGKKED